MRHRKKGNLLSKPSDQRKALLRSLTTELLRHGQITTTLGRAKALRVKAEKIITLGKRGDLHARRQVAAYLYGNRKGKIVYLDPKTKIEPTKYKELPKKEEKSAVSGILSSDKDKKKEKKIKVQEKTIVQRLFEDIAPKYSSRSGGYIRIIKAPPRRGDAAPMAIVQLV